MIYDVLYKKIGFLLEEAYQYYYPNNNQQSCFKIIAKTKIFLDNLYEQAFIMPSKQHYKHSEEKSPIIEAMFNQVIQNNFDNNGANQKIAAYFVSIYDHSGVYFSEVAIANHLYEIKNLQTHGFTVYPYLVSSKAEVELTLIRKPADLLYINAHGSETSIELNKFTIAENLKFDLKQNASIILNSCSTAKGIENSLAEKVAKDNPGTQVFGALNSVLISNINFADKEDNSYIENVEYQAVSNNVWHFSTDYMHKFCFTGEDNGAMAEC